MGNRKDRHTSLTAGIKITGITERDDGTTVMYGAATLTGVVRVRGSTDRMVGTVLHAFNPDDGYITVLPSGTNRVYQSNPGAGTNLSGVALPDKVLGVRAGQNNTGEFVLFTPQDENGNTFPTDFFVHGSPHNARKIVYGRYNPRRNDTLLGAGQDNGLREVTVVATGVSKVLGPEDAPRNFTGLIVIEWPTGTRRLHEGDSGAPLLKAVGGGKYKMAGIFIASDDDEPDHPPDRTETDTALPDVATGYSRGYAFPASVVESEFGVSFGKAPPRCVPGPSVTVNGGVRVMLDGSNSVDDDGMLLRSQWVQTDPQDEEDHVALTDANTTVASFEAPLSKTEQRLTFELTVTDVCDQTDTDTVTVTVEATPEVWPEEWTPSVITIGTGADRRRLMYKVSNFKNIRTEWQSDPDTTTTTTPPTQAPTETEELWPEVWTPTEAYSGYGLSRERLYLRVSNLGNTEYEWRLEPDTTGEDVHENIVGPPDDFTTAPPTQAPPTTAPPTTRPPTQAPPTTRPPTTRPPTQAPPTTRPPTTRPPTTRPPTTRPPTTRPPTTRPPTAAPTTPPPTTQPPTTAPPPDDIVGPPDDFTTAPPTTAPPTTRPPTQAPETWGPWTATGRERWNGLETEYKEERTSSRGRTQTRWVP